MSMVSLTDAEIAGWGDPYPAVDAIECCLCPNLLTGDEMLLGVLCDRCRRRRRTLATGAECVTAVVRRRARGEHSGMAV